MEREPGVKSFQVQPRRWVVERPFAWLSRYRRLAKDNERRVQTSETLIAIGATRSVLRRPAGHVTRCCRGSKVALASAALGSTARVVCQRGYGLPSHGEHELRHGVGEQLWRPRVRGVALARQLVNAAARDYPAERQEQLAPSG